MSDLCATLHHLLHRDGRLRQRDHLGVVTHLHPGDRVAAAAARRQHNLVQTPGEFVEIAGGAPLRFVGRWTGVYRVVPDKGWRRLIKTTFATKLQA